jgi:hypothetical protein
MRPLESKTWKRHFMAEVTEQFDEQDEPTQSLTDWCAPPFPRCWLSPIFSRPTDR